MKKRCRVCKNEYVIDDSDFNEGQQLNKQDIRCCSQACYEKYQRFLRARERKYQKPMHKSDWNPIP